MPNPMARNTLRLLREATNGSPIKNSVTSKKGFTIRAWIATRMPAPKSKLRLRRLAINWPDRGEAAKRIPAVGAKLLERHAADEETLVRLEPGGVARSNQHLLPSISSDGCPAMFFGNCTHSRRYPPGRSPAGSRKKALSAVNCCP